MTIGLILLNILLCFVGCQLVRKKQRGCAGCGGDQNSQDNIDEVEDDDKVYDALSRTKELGNAVTEKVGQALTGLGWLSGDGACAGGSFSSDGSSAASEGMISVSSGMSSGYDSACSSYSSRT